MRSGCGPFGSEPDVGRLGNWAAKGAPGVLGHLVDAPERVGVTQEGQRPAEALGRQVVVNPDLQGRTAGNGFKVE